MKHIGNYVHFKGITIQGAGDNDLQVTGSNNIIELCTTRWKCDAGMQMKTGSNNLMIIRKVYNFKVETSSKAFFLI